MRDETLKSKEFFFKNSCYTLEDLKKDYHKEIAYFNERTFQKPQRAARLSAAVKRYKTSEMLRFIFSTVAHDPDPDLTPLTVKRLCRAFFGRNGSQSLIVSVFGVEGRQHKSPDCSPDSIGKMEHQYRNDARHYWERVTADIQSVKLEYRQTITQKNEAKTQ